MGIRFYCPNGHKLNVKEFQAGRRGICPFCGTRTQIPLQSTRPSTKAARQQRGGSQAATQTIEQEDADSSPDILPGEPPRLPGDPAGGSMLGPSTPVGTPTSGEMVVAPPARPITNNGPAATPAPAAAFAETKFRPDPVQPASPSPVTPSSPPSSPVSSSVPTVAVPILPVQPSPAPAAVVPPGVASGSSDAADPLAESPDAIWYVRPPSGGQFGPATGDLMRSWLNEGRVSGDSLVWREGWRDWREASELFPKLRGNQIIDFLETAPVVSIAASSTAHHHHHKPKPKRKSDRNQTALLIVLSLAVIVLFIVFLLVLFH